MLIFLSSTSARKVACWMPSSSPINFKLRATYRRVGSVVTFMTPEYHSGQMIKYGPDMRIGAPAGPRSGFHGPMNGCGVG